MCVSVHVSAAFFGTWICPELRENGWVLPGMGHASSKFGTSLMSMESTLLHTKQSYVMV